MNVHATYRRLVPIVSVLILTMLLLAASVATARADVRDTDLVGSVPLAENQAAREGAPDVLCDFGALMAADGTILWQRASDAVVPMASTTKVMTALVVLDQGNPTDAVTVSQSAAEMDGSTAELAAGDVLSMEQLLYAMMLPSGNDAATALAEHYGGGDVGAFVALMNEKAAQLGMTSTHYSSPSGLSDEDNYTTAIDYLKLVSAAMGHDLFRQVVATPEYSYYSTARGYDIAVYSTDELLYAYEGAIGIKTGFTDAAGYCFIGAAARDGVELYSVVLHSADEWSRFSDTIALMDWGFAHYRNALLLDDQTIVGEAVATSWLDKTIPVRAGENAFACVFDYEPDLVQQVDIHDRGGVIDEGSTLGSVRWLRDGDVVAQVNLVSTETVPAPSLIESAQIAWYRFASFFTGDVLSVEQSTYLGDTFPLGGAASPGIARPPMIQGMVPAAEPGDGEAGAGEDALPQAA